MHQPEGIPLTVQLKPQQISALVKDVCQHLGIRSEQPATVARAAKRNYKCSRCLRKANLTAMVTIKPAHECYAGRTSQLSNEGNLLTPLNCHHCVVKSDPSQGA
jgi:hypothetical protein